MTTPLSVLQRRPVLLGLSLAGVAVLGGLAAWQPWRKAPPAIVVERRTLQDVVEVSGVVAASTAVTLKAETTGVVKARLVPENGRAKQGQALLQLDDTQARLQLETALANAETAERQAATQLAGASATRDEAQHGQGITLGSLEERLRKARLQREFLARETGRIQALLAEGGVTVQAAEQQRQQLAQARLDESLARQELARARLEGPVVAARNAYAAARTAVANAARQGRVAVAVARDNLARTTLRAPFAGTLTDWLVEPGAWVTPGTPLAQLQDLGALKVELPVDEIDVPKLRVGGTVQLTFDPYPDAPATGTIAMVSRASVTGSGNVQVFPVEVRFADPAGRVKPGMSADARIVVRQVADVLAVPVGAVERKADGFVVKVVQGRTTEERRITPGITTLEHVEVKDGLREGEQVVYQGAASPAPGARR
ncbi:MAG: efflux RND transporter periplasmic adaptor subunit [Candidatus Sericytochromatia bacterium]|nr:efflux RND transporter periplasmic adaptor subunit [Candidatus Sericytochromatia bacterium]